MTEGYVKNVEKLVYQNGGEMIDFFEGSLLDNALYQAKRGLFAIYEAYETANSSKYMFKFARTQDEQEYLYAEFDRRRLAVEGV